MKVAVMGYGTVGSGVCEVIETHQDTLAKRTGGKALELARILDLREFPGDKHEALFTKDFNDILNDPEIQIVAETMGGVNPAFDFTMKLLASGKSVVTSNKELVAQKGPELLACAKAHNVNYLIEASVGGGIPIIRPMAQCLAANHIEGIAGILNGTTNFILTQMIEEDMSFADALALAQANGLQRRTPPPMWRAMTPAARCAFWLPWPLASMCIPLRWRRKVSPRSPWKMWPMWPLPAA